MKSSELSIPGLWLFEPTVFPDDRGRFAAPFQGEAFHETLGFGLVVRQTNSSRSGRGVVRGLHYADTPPGQAKYLYCASGSVLDVIVDLRVGSPAFGQHEAVELDAETMRSVYLSEGLGHAFMALEDNTVVDYLCSTPYNPIGEHGIMPLDPALALPWPSSIEPRLSDKDASAPTLDAARNAGLLPDWNTCMQWYETRQV